MNKPIEANSKGLNSIVIENKKVYYDFVSELIRQSEINEGDFVLSENNEILDFSKNSRVVSNLFNFELGKKDISELLKYLDVKGNQEFSAEIHEVNKNIGDILDKLLMNESLDIYQNEFSFMDVLKLAKINVVFDCVELRHRIVEYIQFLREYCSVKLFVICGIYNFISPSELESLVNELICKGLTVLFVDGFVYPEIKMENNSVVIDSDLCVIQ